MSGGKESLSVAVIGGGAAGFFAALSVKQHHPSARVVLFEKSATFLAKVKVSGGGRCNVTHAAFSPSALAKQYPRGGKELKKAFNQFHAKDTVAWFAERGVALHTEADNRMFPVTNDAQTIIDCLVGSARKANVELRLQHPIRSLQPSAGQWQLDESRFDRVIVATGGGTKLSSFDWLANLGHRIAPPVPSLFTFNMPNNPIVALMGVVVPDAVVRIQGTKLVERGPVLITHWGMSGPAILKLSAWGARDLAERGYRFITQINWLGTHSTLEVERAVEEMCLSSRNKKLANACPFELPRKFWEYALRSSGNDLEATAGSLGKKQRNRLINALLNDCYHVEGKTTFKEEFVTCGGVSREDVDFATLQSRVAPGLYFAGEVLDIDGVTGGFNFQAAWTTGFIAGKLSSN